MISSGRTYLTKQDIFNNVSGVELASYYFGIKTLPELINSPLRKDEHPSFYLYSPNMEDVNYIDFSTGERGNVFTLLMKCWNTNRYATYKRIWKDIIEAKNTESPVRKTTRKVKVRSKSLELQCQIRPWEDYDIKYWSSYGISLKWLKYCDVYPIKYKIIIENGSQMVIRADKYAYTFVERKEGRITHKFYQPMNKSGYKWQNNHDKSVLGLWTKIPEKGKVVCICSSVKDALCLMANVGVPSICLQGEGYPISDTAMRELKRRFNHVCVCLDNDKTGLEDARKLADRHNLINIVIPEFSSSESHKDISDFFKAKGREIFVKVFTKLFKNAIQMAELQTTKK